jgi:hypothetical protein
MHRALFALCSLLSGCIATQRGDIQGIASFPAPEPDCATPHKVALETRFQVTHMLASDSQRQSAVDHIEGFVQDALESTRCLRYSPERDSADVVVQLQVRDEAQPRLGLAMLSGATLLLVPTVATDHYRIDVEIVAGGQSVAHRHWEHEHEMVMQLFVLFAMPAAPPARASKEMFGNLGEEIVDMVQQSVRPGA